VARVQNLRFLARIGPVVSAGLCMLFVSSSESYPPCLSGAFMGSFGVIENECCYN
jgi:hypothetical protein